MHARRSFLILLAVTAMNGGCSREARSLGPSVPQTAPHGADDPRIAFFQDDAYQVAQGGRYFLWYGCAGCHATDATGALQLGDDAWRRGGGFGEVYRAIAQAHPQGYGRIVPPEQLWQITAFVRDLSSHTPEKRRRLDVDQSGEPQAGHWSGPLR